ncbi:MAG TPA: NAD-dependent epimerase/dehydratase family protein [Acidimicrobiales bacterium]|nr:NAD-dependent epimerase/dehydratase family protein [Acidimicrobiales bacterium]
MALHLIVGAGPVGTATAKELVKLGHDVRIVTRSGSQPALEGVEGVKADAADREAMSTAAAGAAAIYNCANPKYHRWPIDWPPIAGSLLDTAAETGAVLVTMSNLYGYGPVDHPMRETDPLAATSVKGRVRAQMWEQAIAAHEAGRAIVTEARASDFFGPGLVATSHLGQFVFAKVAAGKAVRVVGDPAMPHSWTYMPDVGRTLAILGTDERAWGKAWHVPTAAPASVSSVVESLAALAGIDAPKVGAFPRWALRAIGTLSAQVREVDEVLYQFERPFELDSRAFTSKFGLEASPFPAALAATLKWFTARERGRAEAA